MRLIKLKAGDILVVTTPQTLKSETVEAVKKNWELAFTTPHGVMIFAGGDWKLNVVRPHKDSKINIE